MSCPRALSDSSEKATDRVSVCMAMSSVPRRHPRKAVLTSVQRNVAHFSHSFLVFLPWKDEVVSRVSLELVHICAIKNKSRLVVWDKFCLLLFS